MIVNSVIIAMTFFVRARSLLPLATGRRTVHPWQSARRPTPPHVAHANESTNEAHHVAQPF
jgi:hypothetical protein